jgi:polyhydroxybutyrate depolymerase
MILVGQGRSHYAGAKLMRAIRIVAAAILGLVGSTAQASTEQRGTVQVQGREHTFSMILPDGMGSGKRYPIVMALHGGGGNGRRAATISGLARHVDREGFIAVFPDAGGRPWNDGRETTRGFTGDVSSLRAVVQKVVETSNGDPNRVFVMGISNGGMMVQRLACEAPDVFRAYAALVGNLPTALSASCNPGRPVPIVLMSGTDDRLMPFKGGDLPQAAGRRRDGAGVGGRVMSAPASVQFWSHMNGCRKETTEALPDRKDDGTQVTIHRFAGCKSGGEVVFYEIKGGGHNWPGGAGPRRPRLQRLIGNVSQEIDATSAILDFFRRYGL